MSAYRKTITTDFNEDLGERRAIKAPDLSLWECFEYQSSHAADIELYAFVFVGYVRTRKEAEAYLKWKPVEFVKNEEGKRLQRWGGYKRLGITNQEE